MGGGGTASSGNQFGFQNTTSTYSPDPMAYNYLMSVLNMGANVGGIPYQPYTGQQLAGFTQDQLAAMQGVRNATGAAQPYLDQASQLTANAYALSSPSNFSQAAVGQYANPMMNEAVNNLPITYSQANVAQYYDPRVQQYLNNAPMTYSKEAVNQYYNPYQEQVIGATQKAIEQQNAQQMQQQQAEAIRSGAFGGQNAGAQRAMLAGQQALSQNQVLGNLRQQGYQNALQTFQQQQAQALAAATQQQQAAQAMFGQQQAAGLNARQQQYAQALAEYNQQQQQAIQAAQQAAYGMSQLGTTSQQAQLQGAQALLGSGQLQQQLNQQQLNNQYSQWLAAQSYPYMQTAFMAGLGSLAPGLGGTTNTSGFGYGSSNQQQSGGSAAGQIGGAVSSLAGLIGMFSDERAKTNIDYVGEDPKSGYPIYAYDYKSDVARSEETGKPMPPKRMGPMAQDVAERDPSHAVDIGGLLGIKLDRHHKADGGSLKMVPIQTYTGQAAPSTGITDLSSLAYPQNPNFPVDTTSGLASLFTPYEEYQKIGKRWVSPGTEEKNVDLEPFEYKHVKHDDREERADGGMLPDQSNFLEMSKTPPYGLLSNPKVASAMLPIADIPEHRPQTPDLGYIPGLPGGAKGHGGGGGGGGGGEAPSIPKLGKSKSSSGGMGSGDTSSTAKQDDKKTDPSILDKIKGGIGDLFTGGPNTSTAAAPAPSAETPAAGGDFLGGLGKMFGGLFNEGGRVKRADGGALPGWGGITGSQLGPIMNPYGSGQISGFPAGVGAFNAPINTGVNVQQAFGPYGLGRAIPQSLANFRMPWTAVNTGSPAYNNLLLQASQNIGPRQLTPQEFGMPSIASAAANYSGQAPTRVPTQAQIDATTDEVEKANLQNQLDLSNLKNKYPNLASTPSNYTYQMTDMMTPEGLRFMVPVSGYSSPSFYVNPYGPGKSQPTYKADGGSVRGAYGQGGRSGLWGKLQDAEEGARAAALAIKEDAMHPQEVLHSIWNRAKSGLYGETPSEVMTQRRQYEPMNPSNRGTSRDPRTVDPNNPKVRELAEYWSKIKSGQVEDPTGGATHFMNPAIVGQRRHGHFKPWERTGLNDPSSVKVGQQIFYNPNRNAPVAQDRPKGDYFSNLKPPIPYGPGDKSVLSGGQGKFGEPISPVAPMNDTFGKGLDLSGGPMNLRGMPDVYPVEPKTPNIGSLADLSPAPVGPESLGITHNFETDVPEVGFSNRGIPATAPGYRNPIRDGQGFANLPPQMPEPTSETNKVTEVQDGRHPTVKTTAVSRPRPGTHVAAEKTVGFGPVAKDTSAKGEEGGFDLGGIFDDLFGGKDAGYLQGPDIGDLADIFGFNAGGRVGYKDGGGSRAKEAWDYLINEAGASPAEAQVLIPAAAAESAFDPTAVHDQGTGYGLFGHRLERADALRKALGEKASDFKEQLGFGLKEFRGRPEHRYVEGENPTIEDIMQAHGAFERPAGYRTGAPEGMKNYAGRRALTEAAMKGNFDAFANYKGSAGGGGGNHVVATDRGDEGSDDTLGGLRHMLGGDNEQGTGLFGMKPLMNRDLAMYLLATGSGMMASRNRSPLGAFGEGSLQGIEALQASRAERAGEAMKNLQAANLMSEMQKRNYELSELMRRTRAQQELLKGMNKPAGGGAPPVASDAGVAPGAMPEAPEAPKLVEPTPAPAPAPEAPVARDIAAPAEKTAVEAPIRDPYDADISKFERIERENRATAQRAASLGIPEQGKEYEDRADKAAIEVERLKEAKRKSLTEKVDENSPLGQYRSIVSSPVSDFEATLNEARDIINDPNVAFGPVSSKVASGKTLAKELAKEASGYLPANMIPDIDTTGAAKIERLGAIGKESVLKKLGNKLNAGTSNADVAFMMDTDFNPAKSKEFNQMVLEKKAAAIEKEKAVREEAIRYAQEHGGIDAGFQTHMSNWGEKHPIQSFMRKEAERKTGEIGGGNKEALEKLKIQFPHMSEDQMRELLTKLRSGAK